LEDRILSNGAHTRYVWDIGGRLTQLQNTTITGQLVNNTRYTRDRIGNILTQIETGQTVGTGFNYDPEYRLLSADYLGTANDEAYSYDKVGNRLISTQGALIPIASSRYYNYNAGNRMTDIRIGSTTGTLFESYAYDDNGSMTGINGNRNLTLTWDLNNRVSQINTNTFNYDPSNYRIKKSGNVINNYYLEGENLEAVYNEKGIVQAQYLRGSVIDEIVNGYQLDATGKLVNTTYHHDALQSVLGQSGHEGSILATQSYSAFGSLLSQTGSSNNAQKYTGREIDGETGFYYYRARYYDPVRGDFISEDPKGFSAGVNFYAYANNNPVNANDPSGEIPLPLATGLIGAGAGAIGSAAGQVISNGGFDNFRLQNVWIAAGVGFVAGSAAPYTALTWTGAAITNSIANMSLYGITQTYNNEGITPEGVVLNGVTGIVGGLVSGPIAQATGLTYAVNSPWISSLFSSQLNNDLSVAANTAVSGIVRNVLGATTSSIDPLSVYNSIAPNFSSVTAAAEGGFLLYPNKSNTNMMTSVYSK
jgi:RHS repeat-associated protein